MICCPPFMPLSFSFTTSPKIQLCLMSLVTARHSLSLLLQRRLPGRWSWRKWKRKRKKPTWKWRRRPTLRSVLRRRATCRKATTSCQAPATSTLATTKVCLLASFAYQLAYLWSPYGIGQTIIFLPCDFFFFFFFFFFFLLSFFSSPNLSRRRLDVCHTSTHGVALVRI